MQEKKRQQENKAVFEKIKELAARAVGQLGLELVEIEWKIWKGKPHIVVYIDHIKGISLEQCQEVSNLLGELLDREDPFPERYFLEISSPGVERKLKKASDYERFVGKDINIRTNHRIDGSRRFRGLLKDFSQNTLTLLLENGKEVKIDMENVAKANLWYKQGPRR